MQRQLLNLVFLSLLVVSGLVYSQSMEYLDVPVKRQGVRQQAIMVMPDQPFDTALLFFKGTDGPVTLRKIEDFRWASNFFIDSPSLFNQAKVALVIMACPTDQMQFGDCKDWYRKSQEHADDTLAMMRYLKQQYGVDKFYVMGHSSGTISSRWLAVNLGDQLVGSINASTMFKSYMGWAQSALGINTENVKIPMLYVHHRYDECPSCPYSGAQYAATRDNLVTVLGGGIGGNRCYEHHHGFEGRGNEVAKAVIKWIKTGEVEKFIGEE